MATRHTTGEVKICTAWLDEKVSVLVGVVYLLTPPPRYEFNESDLRMACDTLDTWLDTVAQGRTNLPPDKIPWSAFRTLLSQCIYGGRIDNDFDQVNA